MTLPLSNSPSTDGSLPTPTQKERAAALVRFQRWTLYLPLLLGFLLAVGLVLWLMWLTFGGSWFAAETNQQSSRALVSGLADVILILSVLPWLLICSALPLLVFAGIYKGRQRQMAPLRQLQRLFWQLETVLKTTDAKLQPIVAKIGQLVIKANARFEQTDQSIRRLSQPKPNQTHSDSNHTDHTA